MGSRTCNDSPLHAQSLSQARYTPCSNLFTTFTSDPSPLAAASGHIWAVARTSSGVAHTPYLRVGLLTFPARLESPFERFSTLHSNAIRKVTLDSST